MDAAYTECVLSGTNIFQIIVQLKEHTVPKEMIGKNPWLNLHFCQYFLKDAVVDMRIWFLMLPWMERALIGTFLSCYVLT